MNRKNLALIAEETIDIIDKGVILHAKYKKLARKIQKIG